jgi:uncharacterized membrane-anchored protein
MNNIKLTLRVLLILAVQIVALLGMIGIKQWTLNSGTPVILETAPIDPRSLFSGDYVRLNYTISTLTLDPLAGDKEFKRHDTVYVVLQAAEPYATPVSAHHQMPQLASGQVALKGEVEYASNTRWNQQTRQLEPVKNLSVHYGIENYYVPEGSGRALERPVDNARVSVRVAVDRFGGAGISAILLNGKERYVEKLL